MNMIKLGLVLCFLAALVRAEDDEPAKPIPSPDKKWEYRVVEGEPKIVNVATGEMALGFDSGTSFVETGQPLWAPDSRRLAFNYRAGTRYYTCAVYELVGGKWKALPALEENAEEVSKMIERAERRDRKRLGVTRDAHRRRIMDEWRVRRWIDADTFEATASSTGTVVVEESEDDGCHRRLGLVQGEVR